MKKMTNLLWIAGAALAATVIAKATGKDWTFLGAIGLPNTGGVNNLTNIVPTVEQGWEAPYKAKGWGWDTIGLRGEKKYLNWLYGAPSDKVAYLKQWLDSRAATFTYNGKITMNRVIAWSVMARGNDAKWTLEPGLAVTYLGDRVNSITGDPRALFTLAVLCAAGHVTHFAYLGSYRFNLADGDYGHDYGYAFDIIDDQAMNKIVEAAKLLSCPIAWISRNATTDGTGKKCWPVFQLRGGIKTMVAYSYIDHTSHYHLMTPRPNVAQQFVKGV